jgi:hypothetical protein
MALRGTGKLLGEGQARRKIETESWRKTKRGARLKQNRGKGQTAGNNSGWCGFGGVA